MPLQCEPSFGHRSLLPGVALAFRLRPPASSWRKQGGLLKPHLILFLEYCFWTKVMSVLLSPLKYFDKQNHLPSKLHVKTNPDMVSK